MNAEYYKQQIAKAKKWRRDSALGMVGSLVVIGGSPAIIATTSNFTAIFLAAAGGFICAILLMLNGINFHDWNKAIEEYAFELRKLEAEAKDG